MARPTWSGSISFGLVNVPVKAYTAVRDHSIHFNQLVKGTGARIKYQNVSAATGEPVDRSDIVLGYDVGGGRYVTFTREELDAMRPSATHSIEVSDFVALDDVDPIYYDRTYWLGPADERANATYQLLLAAMEDRGRVGIGKVVLRNTGYLAAVRPLQGVLALSMLKFADEIVAPADIPELSFERVAPTAKTLDLAVQVIDSLASDWEPERYHDTYTEELADVIRRREAGEEAVVEEEQPAGAQVLDLMAALRASVDAARGTRGAGEAPAEEAPAEEAAAEEPPKKPAAPAKKAAARKPKARKAPARKAAPAKSRSSKAAEQKQPAKRRSA